VKKLLRAIRLAAAGTLVALMITALAGPAAFAATGHPTVFVAGISGTIEIPTAPLAVMAIAGFLATYVIAFLNGVLKFITQAWQRAILSVVASVVLGGASLVCYYLISADPLPQDPGGWVGLGFVVIVVCQASYNLVTKQLGAKQLEAAVTPSA
jgi:hypothetical protein